MFDIWSLAKMQMEDRDAYTNRRDEFSSQHLVAVVTSAVDSKCNVLTVLLEVIKAQDSVRRKSTPNRYFLRVSADHDGHHSSPARIGLSTDIIGR